MTPRELLRRTSARFRDAGIPDPETDSALLLSHLCGQSSLFLRLDAETVLSEAVLAEYEALAVRRLSREPLQYLLGSVSFCGLSLAVDARVLIPRPETEELCLWALDNLQDFPSPRVLDLCCGSGCIGLALKSRCPKAEVVLSDLSEEALAVASANAERLQLSVSVHQGDLFSGLPSGSFHMIVSNPPYIPARDCLSLQPEVMREPRTALDGGEDGLDFYRRIIPESPRVLLPGGILLMELGFGEAESVSALLADSGWGRITVRKDLGGIPRMILAVRP